MAKQVSSDERIRGPGYVGLRQNIANLKERPPFSVGGTLDISACPGFTVQITDESKELVESFDLVGLDIARIQRLCVPSAFNDLIRNEWRIDSSVRLAMECPSERLKITSNDPTHTFENVFQGILKDDLFMSTYPNIDIVPNKLNIYNEGGHFTAHKDSARIDPDRYLGTLIVALHSAHTGGELYVRNEGQEIVYDFSSHSSDPNVIQFAAFLGDCEHEVKPITSGHRVVLTYTLLRPLETVSVLPSEAKLISKTVSNTYITFIDSPVTSIPTSPVQLPEPTQNESTPVEKVENTVFNMFGDEYGEGYIFDFDFKDNDEEYYLRKYNIFPEKYEWEDERHVCNAD